MSSAFVWVRTEGESDVDLQVKASSIDMFGLLSISFESDLSVPYAYENLEEQLAREDFDDGIEYWLQLNVGSFYYEQYEDEIVINDYRLVSFTNDTIEV